MKSEVRIDKWLWAVRLFKTRSLAAEACKHNKVSVDGISAKPSRNLKKDEIIQVRRGAITYEFKVLALAENRMSAKLVPNFMLNITPKEQLERIEMQKLGSSAFRDKGMGRPTKKDRREIELFTEEMICFDEWDLDKEDY